MQAIVLNNKDFSHKEAVRLVDRLGGDEQRYISKVYSSGAYVVVMFDDAATRFVDELRSRRVDMKVCFSGDSEAEVSKLLTRATISSDRVNLEMAIRELLWS